MNPLLRDTAERIGRRPRTPFDLRLGPTIDLAEDDPIRVAAVDAELLARRGELTFGAVIFTHGDLATTPRMAIPGVVLHAPPGGIQVPLVDLVELGDALWDLRSKSDPSLADFASLLSDAARPARAPVPPRLTHGARLEITRIAVTKQLPQHRLVATFVPLLVHKKTRSAAILPVSHWAPNLVTAFLRWKGG